MYTQPPPCNFMIIFLKLRKLHEKECKSSVFLRHMACAKPGSEGVKR